MKFGQLPVGDCEGAVLAHSIAGDGWALKKGRTLSAQDIDLLQRSGVERIHVARLEAGDVHENTAAAEIAARVCGAGASCSEAYTGRCNIEAKQPGLVRINTDFINRFNAIDESVTIATLDDCQRVDQRQVIATVKIIPFSVPETVMEQVRALLETEQGIVSVTPFQSLSVTVINTVLPHLKPSVIEKTTVLTKRRIEALGGQVDQVLSCDHAFDDVAATLRDALSRQTDLILVVGASVTVDRNDTIPAAISAQGGTTIHFGMPVDPGNMVLVAEHQGTPIVILPGCARSPKLNGIDWLLQRYAARMPAGKADIMAMGVGGLLVDSPVRPLPRDQAVRQERVQDQQPKVAAIVLAAGQSRRMGSVNKLLQTVQGEPLVRRTVSTVTQALINPCVVVTGHEDAEVEAALAGLEVQVAHNPDFADGLSTSLRAGLAVVPQDCDAVIVCLADMPDVTTDHINALVAGFKPDEGRAVGVPVFKGKRGNPVLWARHLWPSMETVSGDVGARHLIGQHEDLVYEVEFEDTAVLTDLDTPEQWSKFRRGIEGS